MIRAFAGRRRQIVGDCVQLSTDVSSSNDNNFKDDPIPMLFDFSDDVAESTHAQQAATKARDEKRKKIEALLPPLRIQPGDIQLGALPAAKVATHSAH
jgi:hypothetical protein